MATPTIPNGEEHFFPIIYEGNGAGQRVGRFVPFTDNGTIANSLIFDRGSTGALIRTPSSDGDKGVFTISLWYKPTSADNGILFWASSSDNGWAVSSSAGLYVESRTIRFYSSGTVIFATNRTFEDTSKFYHILVANDSSQSGTDKIKLYVDGEQITSFSTDNRSSVPTNSLINTQIKHNVGGQTTTGTVNAFIDAYLAEYNFVDGQALTPDTFGVTDTSTGRWIPKALTGITYGTNGFRLQFGSSSALGDDTSGNNNDFSVSNLVAGDQTTDSPTQNHATLNPNPDTGGTLSEGNLKLVTNNTGYNVKLATLKPTSGKYYMEITVDAAGYAIVGVQGVATAPSSSSQYFPRGYAYGWYQNNGNIYDAGTNIVASGSTYTSGDVLAIALDLDNQEVKFYKNNSLDNTIGLNGTHVAFAIADFANSYNAQLTANFGQKSFTYTPPTGFVALQQDNLPETAKGITSMTWVKNRETTNNAMIIDSSRGQSKHLYVDRNDPELDYDQRGMIKFLKGGYSCGEYNFINASGNGLVSWNWVANSGTTASNSDGSITSTVQANTTAGFSIITYTGTGSAGTVGHGLSSTPEWFVIKSRSVGSNWYVYHKSMGATYQMYFNLNNQQDTAVLTAWNDTAPTSSVISLAPTGYGSNNASATYVIYAWHEVDGYSKFGSYTGNGSTDGPFIYTGFSPAFIMVKKTNASADWTMQDTARYSINPNDRVLQPNLNSAEVTGFLEIDFLSNGFKFRSADNQHNASSGSYIYMAFAEHPFVGDGTSPVTAR